MLDNAKKKKLVKIIIEIENPDTMSITKNHESHNVQCNNNDNDLNTSNNNQCSNTLCPPPCNHTQNQDDNNVDGFFFYQPYVDDHMNMDNN